MSLPFNQNGWETMNTYRDCYVIASKIGDDVEPLRVYESYNLVNLIGIDVTSLLKYGHVPSQLVATYYDGQGNPTELMRVDIKNPLPT